MRWFDLPPLWLLVCLGLAWVSPWDAAFLTLPGLGMLLLAIAAGLMLAAFVEFRRAATTVIPHRQPTALITSGIFRWSRNPIYLADVLILLGFAVLWGKVLGFLLVPILFILLERRFILAEEARLESAFPDEFGKYASRTRRWL